MPGKLFSGEPLAGDLPTIVVLPLVDMSVAQTEQRLCDGLTDELSNWLAHIPTLRVVARTSAFAFKGKDQATCARSPRELGATHVLEGSLRRQPGPAAHHGAADRRVHRPAHLVGLLRPAHGRHLPDRRHGVAHRRGEVAPGTHAGRERAMVRAPRADHRRIRAVPAGARPPAQRTAEDNIKAAEYFRRALEADPKFAPALTGLSETLLNGLSLNRSPLEDVKAESRAADQPRLAAERRTRRAVLAVRGWLLTEQFKIDEALPLLQRAIKGNPNDDALHRMTGQSLRAARSSQRVAGPLLGRRQPRSDGFHLARVPMHDADGPGRLRAWRAPPANAHARLDRANLWGPLATAWIERARKATPRKRSSG